METIKIVLKRAIRGFVTGAVGSMATMLGAVGQENIGDLKSLDNWLTILAFAGVSGGITGCLLALDKFFRME